MDELNARSCDTVRDLLPDLLGGRLDPSVAGALESHLEECGECRAEAEVVRALHESRPMAPPVSPERLRNRARARRLPRLVPVAAAAALVALLATSVVWLGNEPVTEQAESPEITEPVPTTWPTGDGVLAGEPLLDQMSEDELQALLQELES